MSQIYSKDGKQVYDYNGQTIDATTGAVLGGTYAPDLGFGSSTPPKTATPPPAPPTTGTAPTGTSGSTPAKTPPTPTTSTSPTGMSDTSFLGLLNGLNSGFQQNNALVDQKNAVMGAMLGNPLDQTKLATLPPDIQDIIRSGDREKMMLQVQILNDAITGKASSVASSIQFLTSGWQTAEARYNTDVSNVLAYAKALNAKPSDVMKALYPSEAAQLGTALDSLAAPLLSTTQIPGANTLSVSIPTGTIASQTNNPLNIKYVSGGIAGGDDSGIKATDGGTFAAYNSPEDGLKAAMNLLKSPVYSNLTVQQAMQRWSNSGYGAEVSPTMNPSQIISSLSDSQLQQLVGDMATRESGAKITQSTGIDNPNVIAFGEGIKNGNITSISQVPPAYKALVAQWLASNDVTSPLADSRFTIASNRIVSNFIALPGYSLVANGLPYLGRIAAAEANPGSVSDQDLLDSLTKLNTSGNAITDAQVSIITGGKSLSDSVSIWNNRLSTGGVLSDDQRQQVQKIANAIYANYAKEYQPIYDQVTSQLSTAQIPPQFWTIPDLNALARASGLTIPGVGDNSSGSSAPTGAGSTPSGGTENDPLGIL